MAKINLTKYILFKKAHSLPENTCNKLIHICVRKYKFNTKIDALHAINQMKKNKDIDKGVIFNIYSCEFCNGFHIGHHNEEIYGRKIT